MRRRHFIALLGVAAAWPLGVRAQQAKARLIGTLSTSSASDQANRRTWQAFVDALRERGWEEGRNIAFERRPRNPIKQYELNWIEFAVFIAAFLGQPTLLEKWYVRPPVAWPFRWIT
jgi:hypothetical protein